jgi:hypothetical protein|tara:strand:+ start:27831 stop:28220 length:390 start_codon:yes stop_codon:yes gene_type:complete
MSRTKKDMPKKVRNYHAVNAHFRQSGPMVDRKKEQNKYTTRASRTIEDHKHNEEYEDSELYEQHLFLADEKDKDLCGSVLSGLAFWNSRNTYFEFSDQSRISYLHSIEFIKATLDPNNNECQACVWKEF